MNKEQLINKIIHGNCLEEMKKIPDNSVDLIFADPPYWMRVDLKNKLKRPEGDEFFGCDDEWDNNFETMQDYEEFTYQWLTECQRILSKNGSIWVIGGMQCIYTIGGIMQKLGFWFINDVIWHKTNPTPNFMGTRLNNSHETLIWATKSEKSKFIFHYKTAKYLNNDNILIDEINKDSKNKNKKNKLNQDQGRGQDLKEVKIQEKNSNLINFDIDFEVNSELIKRKQMGSVWRFAVCSGNERLKNDKGEKLHTTQKPEDLLYRIIALTSNVGDLVFDPFGGTMTTATVAKKLKRNYLTIEQQDEYIKYGKERIDNVDVSNLSHYDLMVIHAKLDEKPLKAPMVDMINANFFTEGEKFFLKNSNEFAILNRDGIS